MALVLIQGTHTISLFIDRSGDTVAVDSLPKGMLADGSEHDIGISVSRNTQTITFFLDGYITSIQRDEKLAQLPPVSALSTELSLGNGGPSASALSGFIGSISNFVINTKATLPYTKKYPVSSFNVKHGYGTCEPYSSNLADNGICSQFNPIGSPIYVPLQRFSIVLKPTLDAVRTLILFASDECKPVFLKYVCSMLLMPCTTYEHMGQSFSFPRPPCRSDCETFMGSCRQSLLDASNIIKSLPPTVKYGPDLYDTWFALSFLNPNSFISMP